MKKVILFFVLFIAPSLAYAQPAIVFETEHYDFGTIPQTEKIEHIFDFTNNGNEELVIEKLVPS